METNIKTNWIENLKAQLIIDEGVKYLIYLDSKAQPTFGIGHLVKNTDPEMHYVKELWPFLFQNLSNETKIDLFKKSGKRIHIAKRRVNECFEKDCRDHINDCKKLFDEFDSFCDELKEILCNMMFNLGYNKLSGFVNMIAAIKEKDYKRAAQEMQNSKWFTDVTNRAIRLTKRMESLEC